MMNLNKVMVCGGVTRDPEMRTTTGGIAVLSFSIATNRKEGEKDKVEYHNIVAFGRLAESAASYLKKGMTAMVEGHLQTRSWLTEERKNFKTEIICERIQWVRPEEVAAEEQPPEDFWATTKKS